MADPISDEALDEMEAAVSDSTIAGGAGDRFPAADVLPVIVRLRAALATIDHYKGWLKAAEAQVDNLDQCLSEMTTKAWDQSHRAEAAEALAVPEGWKVEWVTEQVGSGPVIPTPRLVPLSPTDTPEEA